MLVALVILAALGITFYRAKKKVKEVQKRNAELVDRQSAHGVSAYIRKTTGKSTISLPATEGGAAVIGGSSPVHGGPPRQYPPVSWTEGPESVRGRYSRSEFEDEVGTVSERRKGDVWGENRNGAQGVYPLSSTGRGAAGSEL